MKTVIRACCSLCLFFLVSCSKSGGEKFDENPGSTFKATLTFAPEVPGTYSTNQSETTMSNYSITSVQTTNFGIDSLRRFAVSFNGKVVGGSGSVSTPDYVLSVYFKAPSVDGTRLKPGTYQMMITKTSPSTATAGGLAIRNPVGAYPNSWSGAYPAYKYTNLPYSTVTITKSYTLNLTTGISSGKKTFADGTIDAYFVASSFSESSEVHIIGTFSGAEMVY